MTSPSVTYRIVTCRPFGEARVNARHAFDQNWQEKYWPCFSAGVDGLATVDVHFAGVPIASRRPAKRSTMPFWSTAKQRRQLARRETGPARLEVF